MIGEYAAGIAAVVVAGYMSVVLVCLVVWLVQKALRR